MGQGEFKYLGYNFFARGIAADVHTPKAPDAPAPKRGNGTDASKAA